MQNFKTENDIERKFFEQDFTPVNEILKLIRKSLNTGEKLSLKSFDLANIIDFNPAETLVYITLFQAGRKSIRYGSKRASLEDTLNRDIEMLRKNRNFSEYRVDNSDDCRIMIEYVISRKKVSKSELNSERFDDGRFEIGIDGLELRKDGISYYYMPTEAVTLSHMGLGAVLKTLVKRTPIGKMTNKISERLSILNQSDYEYYLFRTRAFVTYKDEHSSFCAKQ